MSVNYLHGIETIETTSGTISVTEVRSSVIGLVGIAPQGPVNTPVLVQTAADAAQFGDFKDFGLTSGFTIPYALAAIQEYGSGTVIVINAFNPEQIIDSFIDDEEHTFDENGEFICDHRDIDNVVLKSIDGTTFFAMGKDYTVDEGNGRIFRTADGALATVPTVAVSYHYYEIDPEPRDVSRITDGDIVGRTEGDGTRTGAQALLDVFNLFGFNPKIIIAPGFSASTHIQTALVSIAEKVRAVVLADLPIGITPDEAVQARGPAGRFNMQTTSDRVYMLYPYLKHYDYQTEETQLMPYSASMAGLMARTDRDCGYWYSPSNRDLVGVEGLERPILGSYTDPYCELQLLNEKGITTVINSYGSGFKAYGNRLASYCGDGGLETFLTSRRVSDMIAESLERNMAKFIDRPLSAAIIEDIVGVGNAFMRTLATRGALINGKCYVSPDDNTTETLAQGQLVVIYEFTPPAPLERITNKLVLTTKFYEL